MYEERVTIRVFISSTFRDMHAERDYLNRFILPELRSRCLLRGVELVSVDLRWGLTPEEARSKGTLKICLGEMERCEPFFVCLMGERYGWIPAPEEIPQALFESITRSGRLTSGEKAFLNGCYRIDLTTIPPVYRLDNKGSEMTAEANDALVRLLELHDISGTLRAGHSITAQEILKAVFDEQHRMSRAFFYLRRQGSVGIHDDVNFPASFVPSFLEGEEKSRAKLKSLKEQIQARVGELTVREYEADYMGIQIDPALQPPTLSGEDRVALQRGLVQPEAWSGLSGELQAILLESGTVALSGMEEFGAQVLDDLWAGIEAELETRMGSGTAHEAPRYQDHYISNHTQLFVGRRELIDRMLEYVRHGEEGTPLIFTGAAGVGKSALLAKFTADCRSQFPAVLILPYFIGVAPGSEQLSAMLGALCESLRNAGRFDVVLPADAEELQRLFPTLLREVAKQKQVLLIIDALNQLDPTGHSHEMLWFPFSLPPGVRAVVSTQEGDCYDRLASRVAADNVLVVPELPAKDRRRLIAESLSLRGKKLSEEHLERLLDLRARPDAGLPLYLLVALDELCLFGIYEALGQRIDLLAPRLPELFQQVLARLERDHDSELVGSVCCWLAASRSGLYESEIIDLLRAHRPRFQMAHWLRLYRVIQFYLRPMKEVDGRSSEGQIAFFYEQLSLSVFERYFHMKSFSAAATEEYHRIHGELADYFISSGREESGTPGWRSDRPRALSELPYHLMRSGRWLEVEETLTDIFFLEAKAKAGMAFDLAANLSEAAKLPLDDPVRECLSVLGRAMHNDIHFITRHPETLFQCLWNQCRWHDSLESESPYELVGGCVNRKALPGLKLRARLESWQAEKERHDPGFRWVRSLRPPSPLSNDAQRLVLRGHSHVVFAVAFSPDGSLIASGSRDATVRVWDAHTGEERACLLGHRNQVQSVAFSRDGARIVSGAGNPEMKTEDGTLIGETDYTVRVWEIADGTEVARFEGHRGMVHCVAVSPDGRFIASGDSDGVVRLWNVRSGSEEGSFNAHEEAVQRLEFSPDGRFLFLASFNGTVRVWQAETGEELSRLTFDDRNLKGMSLSPDGKHVAISEILKGVTVYDWQSKEQIISIPTTGVMDVVWSIDGQQVIGGGGDNLVHVWEAHTGKEVAAYQGHEGPVTSVAASPDGRIFASGSMDGSVRVWSSGISKPQPKFRGHDSTILCLNYSPDGQYFATGSEDNTVCLWNTADGSLIARLTGHTQPVICVAFLEGGRQLVSGSYDNTLCFWETGAVRKLATMSGKSSMPNSITASPDGKRLAYCDLDKSIKVIDASIRRELFCLRGNGDEIILTISPDGEHLAAAGIFGTVSVWSLKTGAKLTSLEEAGNGIICLAFSPVGQFLACGSIGEIKVWDWSSQRVLHNLEGHTHLVSGVAFSPDGMFIVSEAEDATIRIWNAANGLCVGIIFGGADARAVAAGYPWAMIVHDSHEISLASTSSGDVVGWFPAMPGSLTTLTDRHTWVGVNRAGHVYAFRLEGEEGQSTSVLEQVPLLSMTWDAAARDALRQGDVERAKSLLDYRERVCRDFGDSKGASECKKLKAAIKQSEANTNTGEKERAPLVEECIRSFINRNYVNVVQQAMDLGQKMYLDHILLQVLFISIQRVMLVDREASEEWITRFAPGLLEPIMDPWHILLLKTTLGQNDDMNQLMGLAQTREEFCQACYYIGARLMINGYLEEAIKAFEMSLESNADTIEYLFAQVDGQTIRDVLSRE